MANFIPTVSMLNTSSAGSPQFWGRDFLEGECLCSRQKQVDGLSKTPRKEVSYQLPSRNPGHGHRFIDRTGGIKVTGTPGSNEMLLWILVWLSTCTLLPKEEREVFVSLDIGAAESLNNLLGDLGETLPLSSTTLFG